jgi:hypothetical protein
MHPVTANERVLRGARLWVVTACSAVFAVVVFFLLADLRTSVHEARTLGAGVVCTEAATDCVVEEPVELGPSNDAVRTRMVTWYVSAIDAEPGDSDLVDVLPADNGRVVDLGDRAVAYRVDGTIVALSGTTGGDRVRLAQTGVHAVLVDGFYLAALVGLLVRAYGTVRDSRRAGLGWSDRMPFTVAVRRRPTDALTLVGGFGAIVVFVLATYDVRVWVVATLLAAAVWWGGALSRRLHGVGRHAA